MVISMSRVVSRTARTLDPGRVLFLASAFVAFAWLAVSASCAQPPESNADQTSSPSALPALAGTSWQLVKFQGSDGTTLTPDDRTKYTIEFAADGQLNARIDCNRGRSTWSSNGASQLQFGPLASTRAQCAPESLYDQIVRQWANVRSFVIRDRHLYLALTADGGIYEFEPTPEGQASP
jgi:heat shock protein HslJ